MRKPWQIWLVFLLGLAVVVPTMGWLTVKTIQLDRLRETDRYETELARREAELQERISSALYRMDLKMLPLVAQEAARPYYFYDSFYQVPQPGWANFPARQPALKDSDLNGRASVDSPAADNIPSPLLFSPPEFVLLHFQIGPNQSVTSPQRPVGKTNDLARFDFGVSQAAIDASELRLRKASQIFSYDDLLKECPTVELPQIVDLNQGLQQGSGQGRQSVYNVPAIEKLSQQIADHQGDLGGPDNRPMQTGVGNKYQVQQSRGTSRVNTEFNRRLDSTRGFADQQWASNNLMDNALAVGNGLFSNPETPNSVAIREGVMQPRWVGDNLVLLRRVNGIETPRVQGCWLDWPAIESALRREVADLLPVVEFQPIRADSELKLGTALTTIPVQLVVDSASLMPFLAIDSGSAGQPVSGLWLSLWVAWIGLALAAMASAILLYGVIQLSERRATFVSAVTHELRTPLTTFRMYAEMLAEQMVPPDKQQEYAHTLRVQADRLSQLVENVLQFARLEKGGTVNPSQRIEVGELFDRFAPRLIERAREADMDLSIHFDPAVQETSIETQPAAIEQIFFNLVDNACKYAKSSADARIEIGGDLSHNRIRFEVRDFGPGVAPQYRKRMFLAFSKSDQDAANTAAGVGLGLALCRRMASELGGNLFLQETRSQPSQPNGATFVLELPILPKRSLAPFSGI